MYVRSAQDRAGRLEGTMIHFRSPVYVTGFQLSEDAHGLGKLTVRLEHPNEETEAALTMSPTHAEVFFRLRGSKVELRVVDIGDEP